MDEDDFLLEDEEDEEIGMFPPPNEPDSDDDGSDEEDESLSADVASYEGRLSESEVSLINHYDQIVKCGNIEDAVFTIVAVNPQHTAINTVQQILKDMFQKQGHSRMRATTYHTGPLKGDDVRGIIDEESDDSDIEVNQELREELMSMVNDFIGYLASRDLSQDSVTSRRRKLRHIPAFIIFMFSAGIYDFVISCSNMPAEYQEQIDFALKKINQEKYKILEEMAAKYDSVGRPKIAEKVREMGLSWFYREPAEVRTAAEYRDLNLTADDIEIYKEFRPRYTNLTTALTKETISDYIEVVVDAKKGIYEKLKDKTRGEAINDVKKVFKEWAKQYQPEHTGLADKLIFKDV